MSIRSTEMSSAAMSSAEKRRLLEQLLQKKAREGAVESPLSHGQRALWFIHQLDPDSPAYNIYYAGEVRPDLDKAALARAVQQLVDRHPTLRTTYTAKSGVPAARIHAHWPCE